MQIDAFAFPYILPAFAAIHGPWQINAGTMICLTASPTPFPGAPI